MNRFYNPKMVLSPLGSLVLRCVKLSLVGLLTLSSALEVLSDEREVAQEGAPLSTTAQQWVEKLTSPNYRVRREAFLKLCDKEIAIDSWLIEESKNGDPYRASVAKWLVRLRKSEGPLSVRLEALSDYQSILEGDNSRLFKIAENGEWDRVIELLQIIPAQNLRSFLQDGGTLDSYIQLAWSTDQAWVIPKLYNLYLSDAERFLANQWWKSIGLPEQWRVDRVDSIPTTILELQEAGKVDQAVQVARKNRLDRLVDLIWISSADWQSLIDREVAALPTSSEGVIVAQKVYLQLALNKWDDATASWEQLKSKSKGKYENGMGTLALMLDDMEYFDSIVPMMKDSDAFELLYAIGRKKEALQRVGLKDLTPKTLEKWLQTVCQPLLLSDQRNSEVFRVYFLAIQQIGDTSANETLNKFLENLLAREERSTLETVTTRILEYWNLVNHDRAKAISYLKRYTLKHTSQRILSGKKSGNESTDYYLKESQMFATVYSLSGSGASTSIPAPRATYEYLIRKQMALSPTMPFEMVNDFVFEILEDLHAGRKPKSWSDTKPLKELVEFLENNPDEFSYDLDVHFPAGLLFDLLGNPQDAIDVLQRGIGDPKNTRLLARILARTGEIEAASNIAKALSLRPIYERSSSSFIEFLEQAQLMERAGKWSELDTLRLQKLATVHALPVITVDPNFEDTEDLLEMRPEVELALERSRIMNRSQRSPRDVITRFKFAKKDLAKAKKGRDIALATALEALQLRQQLNERELARYLELSIPSIVLEAISRQDQSTVDRWLRIAHRLDPTQIDIPIDIIEPAQKAFSPEVTGKWFSLYFDWMKQSIEENPGDAMTLNNTAWLCALCSSELDKALEFSKRAVELIPDPTYMDTLAEVYFRRGDIQLALETSQKCRELAPRDLQHRKQIRKFSTASGAN